MKELGASALQLCNERFRIGCFLVDLEWYALCSHRLDCSVPLAEFFSELLQPITEQINNKTSVWVFSCEFGIWV